jgi:glycosyltransferase involved in cell wall biosynthesis
MASGVPVVASRISGIRNYRGRQERALVEPQIEGIAEALERLQQDEDFVTNLNGWRDNRRTSSPSAEALLSSCSAS